MLRSAFACGLMVTLLACAPAMACDRDTGEQRQMAFASVGGQPLAHWEVESAAPHRLVLPNGFTLGVAIRAPTADEYAELNARGRRPGPYHPEMLRIELFDLATTPPTSLTYNWGGANTIQGYGRIGPDLQLGAAEGTGLQLALLKQACVKLAGAEPAG